MKTRCAAILLSFLMPVFTGAANQASPAGTPSLERVLPLRGRAVLEQLQQPFSVLKRISVSPDGTKIFYVKSAYRSENDKSDTMWLLDTVTGHRFNLSGYEDKMNTLFLARSDLTIFNPQWSLDGSQIALLAFHDSVLSLIIWNTSKSNAPIIIPLKEFSDEVLKERDILNWVWLSERNELVIGLRPLPLAPIASAVGNEGSSGMGGSTGDYVWFKSRSVEAKDQAFASGASHKNILGTVIAGNERPLDIYVVDVNSQSFRKIPLSEAIYTPWATDTRPLSNMWMIDRARKKVIFNGRDVPVDNFFESQRHGAVYALDLGSGTINKLYSGYAVPSFCETQADGALIAAVRDPRLRVGHGLLAGSSFARIERLGPTVERSEAIVESPVVFSSLYASSRSDLVYQFEPTTPDSRVLEINLETGRRKVLSPPDFSATSLGVSADGKTVAAVLENANTPPEIYLWTRDSSKWRKLTNYGATYNTHELIQIDKIQWRSKDDRFDIDGFLVKPPNFNPKKKYPLLVFVHGGPGGSYQDEFDPLMSNGGAPVRVFASEGYLVLMPNLRGDAGYSLDFSWSVIGNVGKDCDYDLEAGVDYLIAKGWVDPNELGIDGMSWGGQQVIYTISHTNRFKAAVRDDPESINEVYYPYYFYYFAGSTSLRDQAYEDNVEHYGFDPAKHVWANIYDIRTPLLVRWGIGYLKSRPDGTFNIGFDTPNPVLRKIAESESLYTALTRNHVPIEIMVDHDSHGVTNMKYMLEYQSRELQWFDYFILGKGDNPIPAMKSPIDYSQDLGR